jgi:hypothetical protein
MFNDRLSDELARERVDQRMKEVETYSQQERLGFSENRTARWIFGMILLIAAAAAGLLI